ncbi:uncharacterized protein BP5553_00014 [Venustampulla echinocandica]|uniref:Uncharacterized protein n=1 Tax=Venustampulla echinocandica TaxID=2656787 RepID=A0A370TWY1_9HELO|nr:uncharacterized protein BP5553_00014 [Venustampulla echinocandica]RDL40035.1 hypothetical protein BP5553_00014 [Venustampulla echinocandica]
MFGTVTDRDCVDGIIADVDAKVIKLVEDTTDEVPWAVEAVADLFMTCKGINPSGPKAKGKPEVFGNSHDEVVAVFVTVAVQPETVVHVVEQLMLAPDEQLLIEHDRQGYILLPTPKSSSPTSLAGQKIMQWLFPISTLVQKIGQIVYTHNKNGMTSFGPEPFFTVTIALVVTPDMLELTTETVAGRGVMNGRGRSLPATGVVVVLVVGIGIGASPVRETCDLDDINNELATLSVATIPLPWATDIVLLPVPLLGTIDENAIGETIGKFEGVLSASDPTPLAPVRAVNVLLLLSLPKVEILESDMLNRDRESVAGMKGSTAAVPEDDTVIIVSACGIPVCPSTKLDWVLSWPTECQKAI